MSDRVDSFTWKKSSKLEHQRKTAEHENIDCIYLHACVGTW